MAKTVIETPVPLEASKPTTVINDPNKLHYMDYEPDPETGVIQSDKYHFGEYQPGKEYQMEGDIESLFHPNFGPEKRKAYHYKWELVTKLGDSARKYFTPVKKERHSFMFKDKAFNKINGMIECGSVPGTSQKELALVVRDAAANVAELTQMLQVSQMAGGEDTRERQDTGQNRLNEAVDNLTNGHDRKYVRPFGEGLTTSRTSPWNPGS